MRKLGVILLMAAIATIVSAPVTMAGTEAGQTAISVTGSLTQAVGAEGSDPFVMLIGGVKRFVKPTLAWGGTVTYWAGGGFSQYGFTGDVEHNFNPTHVWVPFVGGGLGLTIFDSDFGGTESDLSGHVVGGVRQFVKENVTVLYLARFDFPFEDAYYDGILTLQVGFEIFLD